MCVISTRMNIFLRLAEMTGDKRTVITIYFFLLIEVLLGMGFFFFSWYALLKLHKRYTLMFGILKTSTF